MIKGFLLLFLSQSTLAAELPEWRFAVSGDSRNCGDVVMPTIATHAKKANVRFYWHLGDFRWGASVDEDILHDSKIHKPLSTTEYQALEWRDFIDNQLKPFEPTKVYLSIGNHELIGHTRADLIATFHSWFNGDSHIYHHWTQEGLDFISLDNASYDQFDSTQMDWFRKLIASDEGDSKIKTIVVGMHEALPDSISFGHSMSESKNAVPVESGREVYRLLLAAREKGKHVYILASHSHFFMEGIFNTSYWKSRGGVLPGWIIGTAGAVRYPLPKEAKDAKQAKTHVYGYLLGTASADGVLKLEFKQLEKSDVPESVTERYGKEFVDFCFDQNSKD